MARLRLFLSLAFCLALAAPRVAAADAVDDYIKVQMAALRVPGAAVAVIRDGRAVKRAVYGQASIEHNAPVTTRTVFPLASMTKAFTATAIMTLVQDGKLRLDQPVREILPELPAAWSAITIRQCLSHTSGLPDAVSDDLNVIPVSGDRDALLALLAQRPLEPPGVRSAYNQTGYILLGMIIERLSGRPYATYIREQLLNPAGASQITFGDSWEIVPGRAELYTAVELTADRMKLLARNGRPVLSDGKVRRLGLKPFPEAYWPIGGLNASLDDFIAFELALGSGRLISPTLLEEMAKPIRLADGREGVFSAGFIVGEADGQRTVSYGGGAATWRLATPSTGVTVIVLTNLQGSSPQVLATQIAALAASTR